MPRKLPPRQYHLRVQPQYQPAIPLRQRQQQRRRRLQHPGGFRDQRWPVAGHADDSVQDAATNLAAGDVIYVDSGTYGGFSLDPTYDGVLLLGSPYDPTIIKGPVTLTGVSNVTLEGFDFDFGVTLNDCTDVTLINDDLNSLDGGITIVGGSNDQIVHDTIVSILAGTDITLTGDAVRDRRDRYRDRI